jgi:hypothetical protein
VVVEVVVAELGHEDARDGDAHDQEDARRHEVLERVVAQQQARRLQIRHRPEQQVDERRVARRVVGHEAAVGDDHGVGGAEDDLLRRPAVAAEDLLAVRALREDAVVDPEAADDEAVARAAVEALEDLDGAERRLVGHVAHA